jgi:hypothetical protein
VGALSRKHFRVELADGRLLDLESLNADQLKYETTRRNRKWPMITESGVGLWWTFLAWSAATRTGVYDGTWEQWSDRDCVDLDNTDDDGGDAVVDGVAVDPTNLAAIGNSSSP